MMKRVCVEGQVQHPPTRHSRHDKGWPRGEKVVHHRGGLGLQESVLPKMRYKCLEKLYVLTVYKLFRRGCQD